MNSFKKVSITILTILFLSSISFAQLQERVLVGYWENWDNNFVEINDLDSRYNVIVLAFLEADVNNVADDNLVSDIEWEPWNSSGYTNGNIKTDIKSKQAEGKTVLISIGGGNGSFKLNSEEDKNTFVSKVEDFISEYEVDGIDLDIEKDIYMCFGQQSMTSPATSLQYLIDGTKEIMNWYRNEYGKKMILTSAPEVRYVTGGLAPWHECYGTYLPFIEQMSDSLDLLMVQYYNSGSIYSIPGWPNANTEYHEGTVDFVIVNTEAVIEGFISKNSKVTGTYSGLPASKVVISLPSCGDAASLSAENLKSAANYIMGRGEKPGNYTLSNSYPDFRGFMTWSASHDAKKCNYSYADAFSNTFDSIISRNEFSSINSLNIYPNPSEGFISINSKKIIGKKLELIDLGGQIILSTIIKEKLTNIKLDNISSGLYTIQVGGYVTKLVVK